MEWLWAIGTIIVLWTGIGILMHYVIEPRRKRAWEEAWRQENRSKWLAKFNAADTDEKLARLYGPDSGWTNSETDHAAKEIKQAREREEARILAEYTAEAKAFYDKLRLLTNARERWELIKDAPYGASLIEDGEISLTAYKEQGVKEYVALLLGESRSGNSKSFRELASVVFAGEYANDGYTFVAKEKYTFPADWDELLTTFYKNPSITDFANQPKYEPSEILLVATEAMRTNNFVVAKLVLAYSMIEKHHLSGHQHSQKYWPYRGAIGEFLLTQLAAFVDSVHLERGLFQKQTVAITVTE